jgi:hypothetical protein
MVSSRPPSSWDCTFTAEPDVNNVPLRPMYFYPVALKADPSSSVHFRSSSLAENIFYALFAPEDKLKSRRGMNEKASPQSISRRKALSMLGLVAALGLATSQLTESEADAQEATPAPTTGTEPAHQG